jgi:hypothetical protein
MNREKLIFLTKTYCFLLRLILKTILKEVVYRNNYYKKDREIQFVGVLFRSLIKIISIF